MNVTYINSIFLYIVQHITTDLNCLMGIRLIYTYSSMYIENHNQKLLSKQTHYWQLNFRGEKFLLYYSVIIKYFTLINLLRL